METETTTTESKDIVQQREEGLDIWSLYIHALKSPITRQKYQKRLAKFLDFISLDKGNDAAVSSGNGHNKDIEQRALIFADRGRKEPNWAFSSIIKFLQLQRDRVNRKEITGATVRNYVKSIKLFCEMADIPIPWKKITRGLPTGRRYADDRIPTVEEVRKIAEYPDRRIKAIVYTMTSSGIRLGAWDYLKWGNITPLQRSGKVVAAKAIVYAGEDEEYFTFISPEAWQALYEWIKYRESSGELINNDSWVMRDLWDTEVPQGRGLATRPKKLASLGIKRLMERAIWAQGLRKKLENGKKRHPFAANHSYRKWFKTRCEQAGMKPINIETLLSHSVGISDHYYRPTENDLLEDYLKAVDFLAINEENRLKLRIQDLTEKTQDKEYIIESKLQDKDRQIEALIKKQEQFERLIQSLIDSGQLRPTENELKDKINP
ncbi:MAG: site-specific integrase [Nitrososphaeraceae archaeon]|nr:site-specific integrase [Nitrososphaeraceae archaeon]